ncbi:MAG: hypothetical protein J5736_03440, partial [Bacilli bacterium]|nr:hypothetical protein [Bacilli bacterium]
PMDEQGLESLGFEVVSFRRIGSICNFVLLEKEGMEERIREAYDPSLLERVSIDPDEIITLQMLLAKKGDTDHE